MGQGDTLRNAVLGAVLSIVLAFLPFSPLLGGIVAGYLQRTTRNDGLRVGAIAGLITIVPLLGLFSLFGGLFFLPMMGVNFRALFGLGFVVVFVFAFFVLFTVALSAVGGYVGVYIATETDIGH